MPMLGNGRDLSAGMSMDSQIADGLAALWKSNHKINYSQITSEEILIYTYLNVLSSCSGRVTLAMARSASVILRAHRDFSLAIHLRRSLAHSYSSCTSWLGVRLRRDISFRRPARLCLSCCFWWYICLSLNWRGLRCTWEVFSNVDPF